MKNNRRNRKKLKMEMRRMKQVGYVLDGAHVLGGPGLAKDPETVDAIRQMIRLAKNHFPTKGVKAGDVFEVKSEPLPDGGIVYPEGYSGTPGSVEIVMRNKFKVGRFEFDQAGNGKFVEDPNGPIRVMFPPPNYQVRG